MATPTISSVSPARGHSGGATLLKIIGTNFQLEPTPPASNGPLPDPPATVRVFLGGTEVRKVSVVSATTLYIVTERHDPGLVALEVRNVGPHGETLGAEVATLVGAYTYARPTFTTKSDLDRLVKAFASELIRQVHPTVYVTAHTDWSDPAAILRGTTEAKLPCVFLAGPVLRPNGIYRTNVSPRVELSPGVHVQHRAPNTDDVTFTIGALADKYAQILSLVDALRDFKLRNPWIYLPRAEGSEELVRYDLTFEGDLTVDSDPSEGNVRTAVGSVSIDGFDFLASADFENDQAMGADAELEEDVTLGITTV